jgi:hypothetical protein
MLTNGNTELDNEGKTFAERRFQSEIGKARSFPNTRPVHVYKGLAQREYLKHILARAGVNEKECAIDGFELESDGRVVWSCKWERSGEEPITRWDLRKEGGFHRNDDRKSEEVHQEFLKEQRRNEELMYDRDTERRKEAWRGSYIRR